MQTTASLWELWLLRVLVHPLIHVDIPQLTSDGIVFSTGRWSLHFYWTYSLQASSTCFHFLSFLDASALEAFIRSKSDYVWVWFMFLFGILCFWLCLFIIRSNSCIDSASKQTMIQPTSLEFTPVAFNSFLSPYPSILVNSPPRNSHPNYPKDSTTRSVQIKQSNHGCFLIQTVCRCRRPPKYVVWNGTDAIPIQS